MFDKSDIRAAVEAGALTNDQATRLEGFLKARNDPDRMLDPENLRFLSNFNDVFLTIGMVILITGIAVFSGITFWNMFGLSHLVSGDVSSLNTAKLALVLTPVPVLVIAWLLAEYFCGRRRLLLPSMALSVAIVLAGAIFATALLTPVNETDIARIGDDAGSYLFSMGYASFGAAAIASGAIFWRFRLPFSLFLLALSVAGLFYTAVARIGGENLVFSGAVTLGVGIGTLLFAVWFDMRDPLRASRNADNAFWLHMAAAPQILWGVRGLILGSGFAPASVIDAAVMLTVLIAFALLSLALNRRALIVSGLITYATTLWVLVDKVGGGGVNTLMLTALIVGGSIVLLGGGWRTARRVLLKPLPTTGMTGRIFPPEPA
jgi:hypothetical protein